ncbi:MAG TPA: shikimate kinase [Acidimicrobiia bacterium]|nr:shikimate kinase [Acidimicrobiia bacterium]
MWLVGMMGSGKTSVGKAVANQVGVPFYDTDLMVTEMACLPIPEIWDGVGEEGFRRLENQVVAAIPESGVIVAAGGGAVLSKRNRERMTRDGVVVWLRCDPELLAKRIAGQGDRPLLEKGDIPETLTSIFEQRAPLYEEVATHIIDTDDLSIEDIVLEVVEVWEQ